MSYLSNYGSGLGFRETFSDQDNVPVIINEPGSLADALSSSVNASVARIDWGEIPWQGWALAAIAGYSLFKSVTGAARRTASRVSRPIKSHLRKRRSKAKRVARARKELLEAQGF